MEEKTIPYKIITIGEEEFNFLKKLRFLYKIKLFEKQDNPL